MLSCILNHHLAVCQVYENLTVHMQPVAVVLNDSIQNIQNEV